MAETSNASASIKIETKSVVQILVSAGINYAHRSDRIRVWLDSGQEMRNLVGGGQRFQSQTHFAFENLLADSDYRCPVGLIGGLLDNNSHISHFV
jgi:hypothetical protein